ncbi:MAG: argininosuccinate synthase [Acidobacteria bacterium]|nr:argininosuccinate synthase [Acidobacteriota bacterium]
MTDRIVFAYSGAPDAWAAIASTAAARGAAIVTLTLDLGQGADLEEIRDRALAAGALRAHVLDVREEFARDYVLRALHAGTLRNDPTALALAAQLVSRKLEEVAAIEGATAAAASVTVHDNLLGRQGATYTLTKAPADAPPTPAQVEIAFERGVPVAINGVPMALTELIESLTIIAGHHGVGRVAVDGMCGEAPAASVLIAAYDALAGACQPAAVTGSVRIELLKGDHTVTSANAGSRIPGPGSRLTVAPS